MFSFPRHPLHLEQARPQYKKFIDLPAEGPAHQDDGIVVLCAKALNLDTTSSLVGQVLSARHVVMDWYWHYSCGVGVPFRQLASQTEELSDDTFMIVS